MPTLADHIARIAQDETLPQRVEEAARQTAVLPVLDALGWDCWDGNEVTPEFEVRGGRVDYCLQVSGQRLVLIEVKRTGADLSGPPEEQLLRYAFDEGVPLAALTDGRVWWLYLSTATGSWEQRRFYSIDFRQQEAASAAADLERFLSREGVVSATALGEAQREFESQERARRVSAGLQQAWRQVLGDPDGLLRELLAEEVQEIAGHRPEPETVAEFLRGVSGVGAAEPAPPRRPASPRAMVRTPSTNEEVPPSTSFKGHRPVAFVLDGVRHEVKSWRDLLPRLCEQLARETGRAFSQAVARLRGQPHLRTSAPDSADWIHIAGTDRYVYVNITADEAVGRARSLLRAVRGTADGLQIELAGRATPVTEPASPRRPTPVARDSVSYRGSRVAAFVLDGGRHEVKSWPHLLQALCDQLAHQVGAAFAERIANVRGRTRVYFSERPDDLQHPRGLTNSSLYVEGNVGPDRAVQISRRVLVAIRGSDEGFGIELRRQARGGGRGSGDAAVDASSSTSFTGRRPAGFWLDGTRHEATDWREVLVGVCNLLADEAGPRFRELVAPLKGRVRTHFSASPAGQVAPRALNNGLYLETNRSANDCVRMARRVLVAVRGSDAGLEIVLAE